mgnify:CR=1 FL=1
MAMFQWLLSIFQNGCLKRNVAMQQRADMLASLAAAGLAGGRILPPRMGAGGWACGQG